MSFLAKTFTLAAAVAAFPALASERELPPNTDPYSITYLDDDRPDARAERDREKGDRANACACDGRSAKRGAPEA